MIYDEAEAYRHASHGCTAEDDERCIYCEVEAEAERLDAEVKQDEEAWARAFALTSPIDAFVGDVQ